MKVEKFKVNESSSQNLVQNITSDVKIDFNNFIDGNASADDNTNSNKNQSSIGDQIF